MTITLALLLGLIIGNSYGRRAVHRRLVANRYSLRAVLPPR